jgi:hypothetical protein
MSKRKQFPNRLFVIVIFMLPIVFAAVPGCKDEVIPPAGQNAKRTLTVIIQERDPVTGDCSIVAPNADITVFEVTKDGEKELVAMRTGADGVAQWTSDLPATGINLTVRAVYKNQVQYCNPRVFVFCTDATISMCFESVPPVDIDCTQSVDTTIVIPFVNEDGRAQLISGLPLGVGIYSATRTLFRNSNPTSDICVTVDKRSDGPFSIDKLITSHDVSGENPASVSPGELFTALFSVSTAAVGDFNATFTFTVKLCGSDSCKIKYFRVRLEATVINLPCDCPADNNVRMQPGLDIVPVGESRTYNNLLLAAFSGDCGTVYVDSVRRTGSNKGWTITYPAPPPSVEYTNHQITFNAVFAPVKAGICVDTFLFRIRFVNGRQCTMMVRLIGEGCVNACPNIGPSYGTLHQFSSKADTSNLGDHIAFTNTVCPAANGTVSREFAVALPVESCCQSMDVSINVFDDEASKLASRYFTVSPSTAMTVTKGSQSIFTVKFTAPTVTEFNQLFTSGLRQRTGSKSDSSFMIRIRLTSDCIACTQDVVVKATVGDVSLLSPIRNLRAYGQKTDLVPIPSTEVCYINSTTNGNPDPGLVRALIDANKNYPYPPGEGDIFVEVMDTSRAYPPLPLKEPMLFRREGTVFSSIQRIATGYPENSVVAIYPVVNLLQNIVQSNPGFFAQTSLPFSFPPTANSIKPVPGEVYVLYGGSTWSGIFGPVPCNLAMLYVRSRTVGQGEDNLNTHHQSGIEFRLIYPVALY